MLAKTIVPIPNEIDIIEARTIIHEASDLAQQDYPAWGVMFRHWWVSTLGPDAIDTELVADAKERKLVVMVDLSPSQLSIRESMQLISRLSHSVSFFVVSPDLAIAVNRAGVISVSSRNPVKLAVATSGAQELDANGQLEGVLDFFNRLESAALGVLCPISGIREFRRYGVWCRWIAQNVCPDETAHAAGLEPSSWIDPSLIHEYSPLCLQLPDEVAQQSHWLQLAMKGIAAAYEGI